jgi:hypothetical protein
VEKLDWIFSGFTPGGVLSGLTGAAIAGFIAFIAKRFRKMFIAWAVSNRRYAMTEVRKRVRSDEYHAERQKIQLIGLVIDAVGLFCIAVIVAVANKKDMDAALLALFLMRLAAVGWLLFFWRTATIPPLCKSACAAKRGGAKNCSEREHVNGERG